MENPFIVVGKIKPEYFCDRQEESLRLVRQTTNGANTVIVSPRRLGKTGLIEYCFDKPALKQHYITMFVDILRTSSLNELIYMLGKTVFEAIGTRSQRLMKLMVTTLKTLNGHFGYDPVSNTPTFDIRLGDITNPVYTLEEIFACIEQADKRCIIAIDEFQQITNYSDAPNIEATLRTHIQKCNNGTFIFSGSKRHLMGEIFTSPSRPFYQSVLIMNLRPISVEKYTEFAQMLFEKYGKTIESDVVYEVYQRFDAVTSCIQRVLNVLFMKTPVGACCTIDMVDSAVTYILDMFSETFTDLLERIPEKQREVFIAIALEGKAKAITSKAFIKKHHLQTVSVITAAVRSLLDKDLITMDKGVYTVYDPFFGLWINNH